jgi:uncharacterized protein (DUF58 family)
MSRPHVATPSELTSLRDLEIVARTTVEGLRHGLHRSPFHGFSAEFSQYRHYRPGDDLKYVDWKAFGRTDRLYTRQFRESTNLSALVVLDISRSMDFGRKFGLAQAVSVVLGTLVLDQGDAAGLLAIGELPRVHYLPPRSGHHHLTLLHAAIARLVPSGSASMAAGLARAGALMKRRGLVIAVSDFYDDGGALAEIRRLGRMGHEVVAVQTLAAEELILGERGGVEFVDAETGRSVVVQPETVGPGYAEQVRAWVASLSAAVRREGLDYVRLTTNDSLERELRQFLVSRRGGA